MTPSVTLPLNWTGVQFVIQSASIVFLLDLNLYFSYYIFCHFIHFSRFRYFHEMSIYFFIFAYSDRLYSICLGRKRRKTQKSTPALACLFFRSLFCPLHSFRKIQHSKTLGLHICFLSKQVILHGHLFGRQLFQMPI